MRSDLDFIVIGAQKAGTTSLFEYLRRHPELNLPAGKEVPYFSGDLYYSRDWNDYLSRAFSFADPATKWGTVTPHYMVGGVYDAPSASEAQERGYDERTVPLRIYRRIPQARLIALLRDPVDRAFSHYRMERLLGTEQRSFDRAVTQLLGDDALAQARVHPRSTAGYVTWGEYGRILGGYFDVFPAEQILVLFTHELRDAPDLVLQRIWDFIGVNDDFVPENLGARYRVGARTRRMSWLNMYSFQHASAHQPVARRLWHALPARTRRWLDRAFDEVAYRTDLWNRRAPDDDHENGPAPDVTRRLRAHFAKDAESLRELLGAEPPWLDRWARDPAEG